MGTSDLPEIQYMNEHEGHSAQVQVCIFQKITSAHVTTNIFYLGDTPASVGNYRNAL